jgi:hypothetical protein
MLKGANNILSLAEVRKEWRMKSVHGIGRSLRLMGRGRKVLDTVSRKSKGEEQGRRAREESKGGEQGRRAREESKGAGSRAIKQQFRNISAGYSCHVHHTSRMENIRY